jgi:hypothetical protein
MFLFAISQIREKIYLDIINSRNNTIFSKLLDVILPYEEVIEGIPNPNKHLTLESIPIHELGNFMKAMVVYEIWEPIYKFIAIPLRKKRIVNRISELIKRLGVNSERIYAIVNNEVKMYYIAYQNQYTNVINRIVYQTNSID